MTTVAFDFNPAQRRVAKGNQNGGEWFDDAGNISQQLTRVAVESSYQRAINTALEDTGYECTAVAGYVNDIDGDDPYIVVRGEIWPEHDENQTIPDGQFSRLVYLKSGTVVHDVFVLDPELQGKGIGSTFLKACEAEYIANGMKKIETHANIDVGGYTWARLGFEFAPDYPTENVERMIWGAFGWGASEADRDRLLAKHAAGEKILPAELAMLGWTEGAETWPGKKWMLGTNWNGVKYLTPETVTAAAVADPRARQIGLLHDAWVSTARYDSIPVAGPSQYPETEEDVHTHPDSEAEFMLPLIDILGGSLVADMAGYIADEPTYTGCIIALIPAAADPITAEVAGEPPHVTVVWMGDLTDLDRASLLQIVADAGAYADKLTPITVPVKGRDTFDGGADVVLLEPTDSLVALRDGLLDGSPTIAAAHAAVEQYPTWNPHVTLGYEENGGGYPNTSYEGEAVMFDQLGVWLGDDQYNFPLNGQPALTAAGGGNPSQLRVPRGNGRLSGRWTPGAGTLADMLNNKLGGSVMEGVGSDVSGYHRRELVDYNSPQAKERFRDFDQQGEAANGHEAIQRAYRITGYDKTKPTLVDQLPEGVTPIYRGILEGADQFRNGDHYAGFGYYGNGSYFTGEHKQALQDYAKNNPNNLITAAWKPDARVLDLSHMWPGGTFYDDDVDNHLATLNKALGGNDHDYFAGKTMSSALKDLGAAAALLGYDGIHITKPKGQTGRDYDIVFNREALLVEIASRAADGSPVRNLP